MRVSIFAMTIMLCVFVPSGSKKELVAAAEINCTTAKIQAMWDSGITATMLEGTRQRIDCLEGKIKVMFKEALSPRSFNSTDIDGNLLAIRKAYYKMVGNFTCLHKNCGGICGSMCGLLYRSDYAKLLEHMLDSLYTRDHEYRR